MAYLHEHFINKEKPHHASIPYRRHDLKHCEASVTKAVKQLDPQAEVQIDLLKHEARVISGQTVAKSFKQLVKQDSRRTRTTNP